MDEQALLEKIKQGDQEAFNTFFNAHYKHLCLYLKQFTRDWDTAQEVVQAVFVLFWQKRKSITITASAKGYLYRMAYNQFLMHRRKENQKTALLDQLTREALHGYQELTPQQLEQKIKRIQNSIAKLPPACQEILRKKINGATYSEIATEQNISVKTVESQMRIAYQKLREDLKDTVFTFFLIWSEFYHP